MATSQSVLEETVTTLSINVSDNGTAGVDARAGCDFFPMILNTIAMGVICLLGFIGNTVSFLVLHRDKSTPVASFLLKALAVADNIFLILWVVHYSVRYLKSYMKLPNTAAWLFIRVYTFPILYIGQTLTIWMTVVIALNRFMAVCVPYRAPHLCNIHNVYKEVLVVTIFSVVYNLPRFFELEINVKNWSDITWNRTALGFDPLYKTVYTDVLYYLFTFILPLIILTFVNTRVIIAYRAIQRRRRRMSTRRAETENNITLVMIMVVVIFMLCQAPARIVQMVYGYSYKHCREAIFYVIHISNTLEVLNSSVNFLIYCIFHKRFRDILGETYCSCVLRNSGCDTVRNTTTEGLSLEEAHATRNSKRSSPNPQQVSEALTKNNCENATTVTVLNHNSPTTKSVCVGTTNADQTHKCTVSTAEDDNVCETQGLLNKHDGAGQELMTEIADSPREKSVE